MKIFIGLPTKSVDKERQENCFKEKQLTQKIADWKYDKSKGKIWNPISKSHRWPTYKLLQSNVYNLQQKW